MSSVALRDRLERAIKPTVIIVIIGALTWAWVKHQEHYRHAHREEAVMHYLRDRARHDKRVAKLIEDAELNVENAAEAYEAVHGN